MSAENFEHLKAAAIVAGAEARVELVGQLVGLSVEELARRDPGFWAQIEPVGRERLLAGLAGEEAVSATPRAAPIRLLRSRWAMPGVSAATPAWLSCPPATRAIAAGATAWAACILIGLSSLFTIPTSGPWNGRYAACRRLDDDRPHCAYRVQDGLSWLDAAAEAGVDVNALRRSNPALPGPGIPAGVLLRIDRPSDPFSFDDLVGRQP